MGRPAPGGTFALVAERVLSVPPGRARAALGNELRQAGFTIDSDHTTLLAARRGSTISGAVVSQKLPVRVTIRLAQTDSGCRIEVRLEDGFAARAALGATLSATYQQMLGEVGSRLDAVLGALDPAAAFPAARYSSGQAVGNNLLDRVIGTVGGTANQAFEAADRRLFGGARKAPQQPQQWARVRAVAFTKDSAEDTKDGAEEPAVLVGREEVDGLLGVSALIGAQPTRMPQPLVDHVATLASRVESGLESGLDVITVPLARQDMTAFTFLREQTALRDALPERRLLICRDCQFEKVVNDDYQRIAEREWRVSNMISRVTTHNHAALLRSLFRRGVPPPEFVCNRCQGMSADQLLVTFCPSCGAQQRDGALRNCSCGFDFVAEGKRRLAARPPFELPSPPVPVVNTPMALAPPRVPGPPPVTALPAPPVTVVPGPPPMAAPRPTAQPGRGQQPPGWYPDPWGQAPQRFWDGYQWTGNIHPPRR